MVESVIVVEEIVDMIEESIVIVVVVMVLVMVMVMMMIVTVEVVVAVVLTFVVVECPLCTNAIQKHK